MKTIFILVDTKDFESNPMLMYYWFNYPNTSIINNGNYFGGLMIVWKDENTKYLITDETILFKGFSDGYILPGGIIEYDGSNLSPETLEKFTQQIS